MNKKIKFESSFTVEFDVCNEERMEEVQYIIDNFDKGMKLRFYQTKNQIIALENLSDEEVKINCDFEFKINDNVIE